MLDPWCRTTLLCGYRAETPPCLSDFEHRFNVRSFTHKPMASRLDLLGERQRFGGSPLSNRRHGRLLPLVLTDRVVPQFHVVGRGLVPRRLVVANWRA